ncbi:MAG: hypothetical protein R6V32_04810 [Bacteroidales bacterium]
MSKMTNNNQTFNDQNLSVSVFEISIIEYWILSVCALLRRMPVGRQGQGFEI